MGVTEIDEDPLVVISERVEKGIKWLTENDEHGNFHFWYKAGLIPSSPFPHQSPSIVERWKAYYANRAKWETLYSRMARLEKERST